MVFECVLQQWNKLSRFTSCTNFPLTYNFLLHLDHKGPLSYIPKEDLKQTWNAMMDAMSLEPYLQLQNDKLYPQYLHYNNTGNWSSHCFPNPNAASINSASTKEFKECQNVNAKIMLPSHSMLQPGFYCYTTTRKPLVHAISSQNMLHNEKVTSVSQYQAIFLYPHTIGIVTGWMEKSQNKLPICACQHCAILCHRIIWNIAFHKQIVGIMLQLSKSSWSCCKNWYV